MNKSKATNISDLTEYIAVPDDAARLTRLGYHIDQDGVIHGGDGEQPEKVLYLTTRGFNTRTFKGQQAEMIALSMESKRSKYPIQHWVASWPEDEQPTPEQIEELLDGQVAQFMPGTDSVTVCVAAHKGEAKAASVALTRWDVAGASIALVGMTLIALQPSTAG